MEEKKTVPIGGVWNAELSITGKFSSATRVGSMLSGIMYSISCSAIHEIYTYRSNENVEEACRRVFSLLVPGSAAGLTVLT